MAEAAVAVCLVLGAGFLAHDRYALNPDAVATAGAAWAVNQRAPVALVADPPLGAALARIAARAAPKAADFVRDRCPPTARGQALADTAPRGGMVWLPPGRIDSGGGPAVDYGRSLADLSGLTDPRPIAPWRQPFDLWLMAPAPDDGVLLDHIFAAPSSSWVMLGDAVILATQQTPPDGAAPLGRHPLGALYLTPAKDRNGALYHSGTTALIATSSEAPPANAIPWARARFSQRP